MTQNSDKLFSRQRRALSGSAHATARHAVCGQQHYSLMSALLTCRASVDNASLSLI